MSRQRSTRACPCARAGEGEKAGNDAQAWETLSRKCNRLGFSSGVSIFNSTRLGHLKSGLCKRSFDCGCFTLPPWAAASVQVQFHSEGLVPSPMETANTLKSLRVVGRLGRKASLASLVIFLF